MPSCVVHIPLPAMDLNCCIRAPAHGNQLCSAYSVARQWMDTAIEFDCCYKVYCKASPHAWKASAHGNPYACATTMQHDCIYLIKRNHLLVPLQLIHHDDPYTTIHEMFSHVRLSVSNPFTPMGIAAASRRVLTPIPVDSSSTPIHA